MRSFFAYTVGFYFLLSQAGVPVYMHYCKGMLESISLLSSKECEDHAIPDNLPPCCKKLLQKHCPESHGKKCCDDRLVILKQNIISVSPTTGNWTDVIFCNEINAFIAETLPVPAFILKQVDENNTDPGPPIYLLYRSLIFYA